MNGRVYDYNLGRFMSVDPFIQAPGNSQSINPYSYIMNNPLSGTDPTGYMGCAASRIQSSCDSKSASQGGTGQNEKTKGLQNKISKMASRVGQAVSNGATVQTSQKTAKASTTEINSQKEIYSNNKYFMFCFWLCITIV